MIEHYAALLGWHPTLWAFVAANLCIALPVMLLLSSLAYRFIELPGMALGKRLIVALANRAPRVQTARVTADT